MKKILAILLILITILSLAGCGNYSEIQEFETEFTAGKTNKQTVSAEESTIEMKDATINFQAESFESESKVVVSELNPKEETDSGLISSIYEVETANNCLKPITFRIKAPEDATSESIVAGISQPGFSKSTGESGTHFTYQEVTIEDGYAVFSIDPNIVMNDTEPKTEASNIFIKRVNAAEKKFKFYVGIFESSMHYEGGHFKVYFPGIIKIDSGKQFLADLETVYDTYVKMGFSFGDRKWPLDVYLKRMNDNGGLITNGKKDVFFGKSPNNAWMEINKAQFDGKYNRHIVFPTIAHELFHLVQINYSSSADWRWEDSALWFNEAVACWMEKRVANKYPTIYNVYKDKLYVHGLFPKENTGREGYARVPIIEYIVKKYGEETLLKIYNTFKAGTPINLAIIEHTAQPETFIEDFFISMTTGEIGIAGVNESYIGSKNGIEPYDKAGKWIDLSLPKDFEEILKQDDKVELNTIDLPTVAPLSGGVVAMQFDEESIKKLADGYSLTLETVCTKPVGIHIIKFKKGNPEVIKGTNSVSVGNLKKDIEEGYKYVAVYATKYTDDTANLQINISLTAIPTLDELVGVWDTASATIDDVYISPEIRAAAAAQKPAEDTEGDEDCDISIDIIKALDEMKGQTKPNKLKIEKISETIGTLAIKNDSDDEFSEKYKFQYINGVITINGNYEGAKITSAIKAKYEPDNKVSLFGPIEANYQNQLKLSMTQKAIKPLPIKKHSKTP